MIANDLYQLANQLERLAERLAADVRPGHVDYISKGDGGRICAALVLDLRQIAHDISTDI